MLLLQKQLLALEFMVHLTGDTAMVDTYKNVSRSIAIMNVLREKIMASVVSDFP
jgi:hypothetical protein